MILAGSYRIAIGEKIFEVSAGASITLPKGVPHSWRNISSEPGRMVVILTPGGFEQCIQTIRNSPPEKLEAVAASFQLLHRRTAGQPIAKGNYIDQRHTHLMLSERAVTESQNMSHAIAVASRTGAAP